MIGKLLRLSLRGLSDMTLHPWAQVLTLLAVTMVSLLAGVFLLVLHNVDQELLRNRAEVEFQVYWSPSTDAKTVEKQWRDIAKYEGIRQMRTFTPQAALADLAGTLGEAGDFSWLEGHNPLPPSAMVSFSLPEGDSAQQKAWSEALLARLKALPGVDKVHYNPLQLELAASWVRVSQTIVWPLIAFLGLVVALVVGNTMKLALYTRRDEIEILALVGAKPWYIRWPILTSGAVQGILGSALSLALLKAIQYFLQDMLNFPPVFLKVNYLPDAQALALVVAVTTVTVLSSWVAVRD